MEYMEYMEYIRSVAFLQCYIDSQKQPGWYRWIGLYKNKGRVVKAQEHLDRLIALNVIEKGINH